MCTHLEQVENKSEHDAKVQRYKSMFCPGVILFCLYKWVEYNQPNMTHHMDPVMSERERGRMCGHGL